MCCKMKLGGTNWGISAKAAAPFKILMTHSERLIIDWV